ncbi:hypothetical protein ACJ73_03286 [Blastomyces percursus]|uniref:Fungal-type protein kinase domain-containing protein n=1 Tax=Blastomyces percursus TaxID=1658174 RepID=A0A1J9RCH2_9EURO|nr:hypothetical protein ACJ73_03286 [Blastomyces percursus]
MLIDLDLAKEVGSGRSGARHQTGTMEFMAIEVLPNIDHSYRHDPESFFYVLLWQCARNCWGKNKYSRDSLIVGTPQDPNRLYDPIIKAYDDAITQVELGNLTHDASKSALRVKVRSYRFVAAFALSILGEGILPYS